ncbi:MAG: hypothetical protein QXK62_04985 [Thermoproteus sp.]
MSYGVLSRRWRAWDTSSWHAVSGLCTIKMPLAWRRHVEGRG